jgi:hypothetical protein
MKKEIRKVSHPLAAWVWALFFPKKKKQYISTKKSEEHAEEDL